MSEAWLYAGVTAAVAAVMASAVWRPRPVQWVLLPAGPLLATGAAAAASVSSGLGRTVLLVISYTYLIVPVALVWGRAWARWAVPGVVLAGCLALGLSGSAGPAVLVVLVAPVVIGVVALFREIPRVWAGDEDFRRERDRLRFGANDAAPPPSVPVAEGVVVVVVALQGVAGAAIVGLGVLGVVLEQRYPTTGVWGPSGSVLAGFVAGLGVLVAAMFLGIAVGLRREYGDSVAVFVVVQVLMGVVLLEWRGDGWTGPGVAWAFGTAAVALFSRERRTTTA